MIYVTIALALSLMIGGGVSVMANDARPGDALYEYKVRVNDNVSAGLEATAEGFESVRTNITNTFDADANVEAETDTSVEAEVNTTSNIEVEI